MQKVNMGLTIKTWSEENSETTYGVQLPVTGDQKPVSIHDIKPNLYGQFAFFTQTDGSIYETVRDPLGIHKLFYTRTPADGLKFAERFTDLFKYEQPIYAIPRGMHMRIDNNGPSHLVKEISPPGTLPHTNGHNNPFDYGIKFHSSALGQLFSVKLKERLNNAFKLIKQLESDGYTVFIALSGGLDSSIIANLARSLLTNPVACTLDLGQSEDAEKAARITQCIDMRHILFPASETEILDAVDESPRLCQDYRDFNVHCTALNVLLAKNIKKWADKQNIPPDKRIILTGDLMNEFTCDYTEEDVDGTIYYRLPKIGTKKLQRQLIGGLDTSDREIFPFLHYGLICIQPYAVTYDLYLTLPEPVLKLKNAKTILNGHLVPPEVIELLPKSKLRAQVGNKENMGVLGLCHREGITEHYFLEKLLGEYRNAEQLLPISMGRYAVEKFS